MSEASKHALKLGMSPTHELMVDWILENPGGTLREMGAFFKYSPSWLCTVMKSDAFKAYAAERLKEVHGLVSQDIPARMTALATLSIERMEEVLTKTEDPEIIKDSFDKVMHRFGYAPGSQQKPGQMGQFNQQNNVFFLTPDQLQQHRETLINGHSNTPPAALPQSVPAQTEKTVTDEPEKISTGG